jgi:hypothetical protein
VSPLAKLLTWRRLSALLIALAVPFATGSCQNIIGIEDRTLGPCSHYCDVVIQNCKDALAVYEDRPRCMAVCKLFDVGSSVEWQKKNTLECRLHEALLAPTFNTSNSEQPDVDKKNACRAAGPEGNDLCGSSCESYCTLYERECGQVQCGSHANCVAKCRGLRDLGEYDVSRDYEGNSLQCRLVHISNAAVTPGGQPHCGHAILSQPSGVCLDLPDSDTGAGGGSSEEDSPKPPRPDCAEYCKLITVSCGTAEYESEPQCNKVCPYFTPGEFADTSENTLGCRLYHAYNSMCGPDEHCPHAGPGGEGHCGTEPTDKCASYCQLAKGICKSQFDDAFPGGDTDCVANCFNDSALVDRLYSDIQSGDALPVERTRYTTAYAIQTPGTLACRFLALSRAAEGDDSYCARAFGDCSIPQP